MMATTTTTTVDRGGDSSDPALSIARSLSPLVTEEYPHQFTGRFWFSPRLVRVHDNASSSLASPKAMHERLFSDHPSVNILSLFGYTLGGTVCLEYDDSPFGSYREFVVMSALVATPDDRGGVRIGQWGSRLFVSDEVAGKGCEMLWGVPAETADIEFRNGVSSIDSNRNDDGGKILEVVECRIDGTKDGNDVYNDKDGNNEIPCATNSILVNGWENTCIIDKEIENRKGKTISRVREEDFDDMDEWKREQEQRRSLAVGNEGTGVGWFSLPVVWTPTIKALWLAFSFLVPGGSGGYMKNEEGSSTSLIPPLPVRRLRLSAGALRLRWTGFGGGERILPEIGDDSGVGDVPLGIGLVADGVVIEIGRGD